MKNNKKSLRVNAKGQMEKIEAPVPEHISEKSNSNTAKPQRTPTEKAVLRAKGRFLVKTIHTLLPFMNSFYHKTSGPFFGMNKVLDHNFRNAIIGNHRTYKLAFSQLRLSCGNLPIPPGLTVSSPEDGLIIFKWTDDSGIGRARGTDDVYIAIYCKKTKSWWRQRHVAKRKESLAIIEVSQFHGQLVEAFIGFVSEDLKKTSNSVYMGAVVIADYVL